ncbi:DgyrCDS7853 [Dimorphilus gyrociliatus]|uniref:DgyrCDS7853 n=1 Tax=Dimorphilus gyrociliatus TaxID=2664684 RepID=A0A7I8VSH9_9ANNE|nr:DgyrCDS7853 [Dimorphilus gyrociliatus]
MKKKKDEKKNAKYECMDGDYTIKYDIRRFPPVHSDAISTVSSIQNGLCLSGSKDKSVILFDFHIGSTVEKWKHDKEVTKTTYDPKSDTFYSCSRDTTIKQWSRNNKNPVNTYNGHFMVVTGIAVNSDGERLCSGSRDNSLRIWDTKTAQCINQNCISRNLVTHIKWAKDSHLVAQTGEDKELRIWDARTLSVTVTFPKKQHIQMWCDWSEDQNSCLTCSNGFGGNGCEATLWDLRNAKPVSEFKGHQESCCSAIFAQSSMCDRPCILTSSNDSTIKVWDYVTSECLSTMPLPASGPVTSLALFPDAR